MRWYFGSPLPRIAHCRSRGLDPVGNHLGDEVEALLVVEPSDHADQGRIGARGEVEFALQGRLALRFALGHGLGVEVGFQVPVGGRVPNAFVDAVEDSGEDVAVVLQHPFQPAAELGSLDLLGVARAHRGDGVGEHDAGLQAG